MKIISGMTQPCPDAVFCASVNAVVRKVLAADIENKNWLPRASVIDSDKVPELLFRILRVCSGAPVTFETML